jgi:hypothetical protein
MDSPRSPAVLFLCSVVDCGVELVGEACWLPRREQGIEKERPDHQRALESTWGSTLHACGRAEA